MIASILTTFPGFIARVLPPEFSKSAVPEGKHASPAAQPVYSQNAIRRLRGLVEGVDAFHRGGYVGWITRIALDEVSRQKSSVPLTKLLAFMEQGGRLEDYEKTVASIVGPQPLISWPWYRPFWLQPRGMKHRPMPHWNLSAEGRVLLTRAFVTLGDGDFFENLKKRIAPSTRLSWLEEILRLASLSPLGRLRLQWLNRLLEGPEPLLISKLKELQDAELCLLPDFRPRPSSQDDGYVDDGATAALIFEARKKAPLLSAMAETRRRMCLDRLQQAVAGLSMEKLAGGDLMKAFHSLEDPVSMRVARALVGGAFELRFQSHGGAADAVYFYPGLVASRAVMVIRRPASQLSATAIFEIMASIVHEFQHHEDKVGEIQRTPQAVFRLELRAHAREFLWRAEWGDTDWLNGFTIHAPLGFALRFRDHFEKHYSP